MDLISRQDAYDVLTEYYHHKTDGQHKALKEALSRVPSAQQGIDKQALLDRLKQAEMFNEDIPEWVWKVIEGM